MIKREINMIYDKNKMKEKVNVYISFKKIIACDQSMEFDIEYIFSYNS